MGLFSKKVTTVDSLSLLLYEQTPNLVRDSIYISVMNDRPIAEDLLANQLNSLSIKSSYMYNYGRDTYYLGLPNGRTEYLRADNGAVKLVIEKNTGSAVYLSYVSVEVCNADYWAWEFMQANRGWDYSSQEVANPPFTPIDPSATVVFRNAELSAGGLIRIEYSYVNTLVTPNVEIRNAEYFTPSTVPVEGAIYYHTNYFLLDERLDFVGERQYYNYNTVTNTEPSLNVPTGFIEESPYYPIIPLRENNVDFTDPLLVGTPQYDTSKECLKKIGLKIEDLGDAINASPDINEVDHAYVVLAVHLQSDKQNTISYLHDYFSYLSDIAEFTQTDFDYWRGNDLVSAPPINTMSISDSNLKVDISYNYANKTTETGSIGSIGFATRTNDVQPRGYHESDSFQDSFNIFYPAGGFGWEQSSVTFRKQISATQYEQIVVYGLIHVNHIYKNYTVEATIADSLTTDNDDFWIPVNINVSRGRGLMVHNELLYDAIRIVFNCVTVTKLKWYETGFFQFLVKVVAIALSVVSLGSLSSTMLWAAGLVGSTSLVVGAAVLVGITIAVQIGTQFLIDVLGIELGLLLSVITLVASIAYFPTGLESGIEGLTFADALQYATQAINQAIGVSVQEEFAGITEAAAELAEQISEAQKELDAIQTEIDGSYTIDPLATIRWTSATNVDTSETPEQFYFRTLNAPIVGISTLYEIDSFVDTSLALEGIDTLNSLKI